MFAGEQIRQIAVGLEQIFERAMSFAPRLLIERASNFAFNAAVDQFGEMFVLYRLTLGFKTKTIFESGQLALFRYFVGGGEQHAQPHRLRHAVLIKLALVDNGQENVEDGRIRFENLIEKGQPGGRQLTLFAADITALTQLADVDGTEDFRRFGEARQHVLEIIFLPQTERVFEFEDKLRLGGPRRPDE